MPIDPNIPLSVQGSKFGEIISQGIQQYQQNKRLDAESERQNKLIQLKEEEAAQKVKEIERKSIHSQAAGFLRESVLPKYQSGDIAGAEQALKDEILRIGIDKKESIPVEDLFNLHTQDPQRAATMAKQFVDRAELEKIIPAKESGQQINIKIPGKEGIQPGVVNPQGQIVDPATRQLIPGAIRAPGQQETGGPGTLTSSQSGKLSVELAEQETKVKQAVTGLEEVKKLVNSPDFVGGATGDAVSMINSAASQFRQVTGADPVEDKIDTSGLSKENIGFFRKAAISKDRTNGAVVRLAYAIAKTQDPGGRLSDADVKMARSMIEGGADRKSILSLLEDNQNRAIRDFNIRKNTFNRLQQSDIPDLTREGVLGIKKASPQSSRGVAQNLLNKSGLGQ